MKFYFRRQVKEKVETLALVSLFGKPDNSLLERSHGTFFVCAYQGDLCLAVINVTQIKAVVAMPPIPETTGIQSVQTLHYLVEKPGLDILHMAGHDEGLIDTDE